MAGALAGFPAARGPLALLTAILGATLLANLALVVFDIARDRAGDALAAAPPATTAPGPHDLTIEPDDESRPQVRVEPAVAQRVP